MDCILDILNNTFFGTLFAGVLITFLGLILYKRQKKIDLDFDDLRKTRENAASLYAAIELATKNIESLFNLYDGKNPQLTKPLQTLGPFFEKELIEKIGNELKKSSDAITDLSESLVTKIKIKNSFELDIQKITNAITIMNLYLQGASITVHKLKANEVGKWRSGWSKAKEDNEEQLKKILK